LVGITFSNAFKDFSNDDKEGGDCLSKDQQHNLTNNQYVMQELDGEEAWSELLDIFQVFGNAQYNANYSNIIGWNIAPQGRILIKTGIRIAMPIMENEIMELQIRSRSGLALKHGICVLNGIGTIDNDYRGELGVILYNAGHEPFKINIGDRIAQGVFNPLQQCVWQEVSTEEFDKSFCDTKRGSGGFGSTGK
jgi:dUTP pyrophosphatase